MRTAGCLLCVCLFASCSSMNYVGIETYNPSEVTFPAEVKKVLVVNNAVPQPDDVGCEFTLFGDKVDTCRVKADSALFYACTGLGKAMAEVPYFGDVLLYHDAVRKDDVYYEDRKLTGEKVETLCDETDADAVVSVDRMLFESKKTVKAYADGFVGGEIEVRMSGVVRAYLRGRTNPLATIHIVDSVFFYEEAPNTVILDKALPQTDKALCVAAEYVGVKAGPNFVPHWTNETRWYYTGIGTKWKEATAYAQSEKWEKALGYWMRIYEQSGSSAAQAKAASNVALAYEMSSRVEDACRWAAKSAELFEKAEGGDGKNAKLSALYVEVLRERVRSDKKLDVQFGK